MARIEMSVRDAAMTAMWRFHDAAMQRAMLMYTFARSTNEDTPWGYELYGRQLPYLIDTVHEFCFNGRRAVERAERYRSGTIDHFKKVQVHYGLKTMELSELDHPKAVDLTQESLWWVMNRIIHSRESGVLYKTTEVVVTDERTGRHHSIRRPVAFGFSSDRDSGAIDHYVGLEELALAYVRCETVIEEAIQLRNHPERPEASDGRPTSS